MDFYTIAAIDGKLNFLIEVTDPNNCGDTQFDWRLFVVVIPNEIFNKYEVGESIVFETYEFLNIDGHHQAVEKSREWLTEFEENSVQHRVGLRNGWISKSTITEIIVIQTTERLSELFVVE